MQLLFLITLIISIAKIKCHVTNRTKTAEVTTQFFFENETRENVTKDDENKKYNATKEVKFKDTHVYLDDVLFSLGSQKWTADEKPCLDHIHRMLHGLQNFTLWAVWGKFYMYL